MLQDSNQEPVYLSGKLKMLTIRETTLKYNSCEKKGAASVQAF